MTTPDEPDQTEAFAKPPHLSVEARADLFGPNPPRFRFNPDIALIPIDVDPIVHHVLGDIADWFRDTDDSEEQPFGEHAIVEMSGSTLILTHQTEAQPVVRITVERLA